jgi:hypothetical protein
MILEESLYIHDLLRLMMRTHAPFVKCERYKHNKESSMIELLESVHLTTA